MMTPGVIFIGRLKPFRILRSRLPITGVSIVRISTRILRRVALAIKSTVILGSRVPYTWNHVLFGAASAADSIELQLALDMI